MVAEATSSPAEEPEDYHAQTEKIASTVKKAGGQQFLQRGTSFWTRDITLPTAFLS
jgi:hypothetical protein